MELRAVDGIRAERAEPPCRDIRDGALRACAAHADRAGGRRPGERIGSPGDCGAGGADGCRGRGSRPQCDVVRVRRNRVEPQRHAPRRQRVGIVANGQGRRTRSRRAIAQCDGPCSGGPIGIAERHRVFTDSRAVVADGHRGEVPCGAISHAADADGHVAIAARLRLRANRDGVGAHGARLPGNRHGANTRRLRARRRRVGRRIAADGNAAGRRGPGPLAQRGGARRQGAGLHAHGGAPDCRGRRKTQGGRAVACRRRIEAKDLHAGVAAAIGIAAEHVGPQAGPVLRILARGIGHAVRPGPFGRGAAIRVVRCCVGLRPHARQARKERKPRHDGRQAQVRLQMLPSGLPAYRRVFIYVDPCVPEYLGHEWVLQFKNSMEPLISAAFPCLHDRDREQAAATLAPLLRKRSGRSRAVANRAKLAVDLLMTVEKEMSRDLHGTPRSPAQTSRSDCIG